MSTCPCSLQGFCCLSVFPLRLLLLPASCVGCVLPGASAPPGWGSGSGPPDASAVVGRRCVAPALCQTGASCPALGCTRLLPLGAGRGPRAPCLHPRSRGASLWAPQEQLPCLWTLRARRESSSSHTPVSWGLGLAVLPRERKGGVVFDERSKKQDSCCAPPHLGLMPCSASPPWRPTTCCSQATDKAPSCRPAGCSASAGTRGDTLEGSENSPRLTSRASRQSRSGPHPRPPGPVAFSQSFPGVSVWHLHIPPPS